MLFILLHYNTKRLIIYNNHNNTFIDKDNQYAYDTNVSVIKIKGRPYTDMVSENIHNKKCIKVGTMKIFIIKNV